MSERVDRETYTVKQCDIGFQVVGVKLAEMLEAENAELRKQLAVVRELYVSECATSLRLSRELTDSMKLAEACSRDCNNTALERNELRGKLAQREASAETWNRRYREGSLRHQDNIARVGAELERAETRVRELETALNDETHGKYSELMLSLADQASERRHNKTADANREPDYGPPRQDYAGDTVTVTSVEGNTIGVKVRTAGLPHRKPSTIIDDTIELAGYGPPKQDFSGGPVYRTGVSTGSDSHAEKAQQPSVTEGATSTTQSSLRLSKDLKWPKPGPVYIGGEHCSITFAPHGKYTIPIGSTTGLWAQQPSAEPVAWVVNNNVEDGCSQTYTGGKPAEWLNLIQTAPGTTLTCGTKLYTAPPSLSAAVALAVERCAEVCENEDEMQPVNDSERNTANACATVIRASIQTLTAEAEAMRENAERYKYWRNELSNRKFGHIPGAHEYPYDDIATKDDIDRISDAARGKK